MSKLSRDIIGKNLRAIRASLGLSLLNFSILTELSKATIVNIESGKAGYNLNLLDNVINFTKISLKELSDENFQPLENFKESLVMLYSKHDKFYSLLSESPEISFALKRIIMDGFLDTPKEIREIRHHLQNIGWYYKGTSISIALKRLQTSVVIKSHPSKKGTHIYTKKNDN